MPDVNTGDAPVRDWGEAGSTFLQWKGTDVCMDVVCLCGDQFHVDSYFAHAVRCPHCGKVMQFGTQVAVREAPSDWDGEVVATAQP